MVVTLHRETVVLHGNEIRSLGMATVRVDRGREIDLRLAAVTLWSRRWWILAAIILCTAAFTGAAFMLTPIYRATTVVVPAGEGRSGMSTVLGQLGGLASIAGIDVGSSDSQGQEALAVLRSREFTEGFIRDEQMMPELFPDRWDGEAHRWKGPQERWPTLIQGFRYFDKHVRTATRDKQTGFITIDIDWRDPQKAASWANRLVARLNAEMRSRAIASTNASVSYLEKELATTPAVETRLAINRLMEEQINKRMLANVTEEYALRVIDRALPSDPKDIFRPNKVLLLLLGPAAGLLLGAAVVLALHALRQKPVGLVGRNDSSMGS